MAVEDQVFVDNGDGTITDTKTKLIWQKDDAGPMRWDRAEAQCRELTLAGKSDWRLPTRQELTGMYKALSDDDHIVDRRLPPFQWTGEWYWSSTIVDPYTAAYLVNFNGGTKPWQAKAETFHVRAVRGE